jgi:type IV pilus assembly protein PilM
VIRWEAEQHVPFDMENVQLDFQILDPDEDYAADGGAARRGEARADREPHEPAHRRRAEPGHVIDVEAFALHNAFERNYPGVRDGLVALVNIGHETTNVNLMSDGAPVLVRDVPFGTGGCASRCSASVA